MKHRPLFRKISIGAVLYLCMMAFPFGLAHAGLACEVKGKKPAVHKKAVTKATAGAKAKHPLDIFHR